MTLAVLDTPHPEPGLRAMMERALDPHILLGMPHLNPHGLSETWLMKELGHRHWLMVARHLGMENADFRTPSGLEAYAAICATSLRDARFGTAGANDILTIHSTLAPVSRTQISSRHHLSIRGFPIADVQIISTFVHRTVAGDNHSIARVALPGRVTNTMPDELATLAADLRGGRLARHFGLDIAQEKRMRGLRFEPDTSQEFNGAGLFYFAQFQALTDRAFERWFPARDDMRTVRRRDVFFTGNLRPAEALTLELVSLRDDPKTTLCRLVREDGHIMGRVFTGH